MTEDLIYDLKDFLNDANLSTYEVNAFITLLQFSKRNNPTARELSIKSGVPRARIYDILEELNTKGLVEIIESRPKKYSTIPLNKALQNLINYQEKEKKRKIEYLYDKANILESELFQKDIHIMKEPIRLFWSTVFGTEAILSMYIKFINEAEDEILFNNYIDNHTLKRLPYAEIFFKPLRNAVERGVNVKILWCFQYDDRTISNEEIIKNFEIFNEIVLKNEELFGLSRDLPGYESKFVHKRIPTLFDIIDKHRILLKLQNPFKPPQFLTCVNMLNPKFATEFREQFLRIWALEAFGIEDS